MLIFQLNFSFKNPVIDLFFTEQFIEPFEEKK